MIGCRIVKRREEQRRDERRAKRREEKRKIDIEKKDNLTSQ